MEALERRCSCGGTLTLESELTPEVRMQDRSSPVSAMSQGALLQYVCHGCKKIVQLLDGTRRGWLMYPALASVNMCAVAGWLGGSAGFLVAVAALVLGVPSLGFLADDLRKRLRYPVLEEH